MPFHLTIQLLKICVMPYRNNGNKQLKSVFTSQIDKFLFLMPGAKTVNLLLMN